MSKIVLLDFDEKDAERLRTEAFDVEVRTAGGKPGEPEAAGLPGDCETVFFEMNRPESNGRGQSLLAPEIASAVDKGGRVVCFVGKGSLADLSGVIGAFPELHLQDTDAGEGVVFRPKAPFSLIFDRFHSSISHASSLFQNSGSEQAWDQDSMAGARYEFLAKDREGHPISMIIRKGKGFYLLLPWFGPKNIEVTDFILKDILPLLSLKAMESAEYGWLDSEEYTFPVLKDLILRREDEIKRHERALQEIEDMIRDARATEQEAFNKLLKAEGEELKKVVVQALKYLGWGRVVDVDEYWKKVIRNKEEDIWLIEPGAQPVEVSLQREPMILVLVRGNRNWATDDECALLQKFKGRRMQEFDNTKMKAVLIGNYFSTQEAKARSNPFAALQIEEAQKDGNGLLTTYTLFRAVKAEKEGRARKESLRSQLAEKTGLIEFEF
jgi:hypothetical protein